MYLTAYQTPLLPPLFLHWSWIHFMNGSSLCCHLWGSACSGFCTPISKWFTLSHCEHLLPHAVQLPCAHVSFCTIYSLWEFTVLLDFDMSNYSILLFMHLFTDMELFIVFCGFHEYFDVLSAVSTIWSKLRPAHLWFNLLSLLHGQCLCIDSVIISSSCMSLLNCSFRLLFLYICIHLS